MLRNKTKTFLHKMEKVCSKENKLWKPNSKIKKIKFKTRALDRILMRSFRTLKIMSIPKMLNNSPKQRINRSPGSLRKKLKLPRSNLSQIPKMVKPQTVQTKNNHRQQKSMKIPRNQLKIKMLLKTTKRPPSLKMSRWKILSKIKLNRKLKPPWRIMSLNLNSRSKNKLLLLQTIKRLLKWKKMVALEECWRSMISAFADSTSRTTMPRAKTLLPITKSQSRSKIQIRISAMAIDSM